MRGTTQRVLIVGHLNLDTPLADLPDVSEDQHPLIRDASLSAFEELIQTALDQQLDLVLLTGNLFAAPLTVRAAATFRDGMEALQETGAKIIWVTPDQAEKQALEQCRCLPQGIISLSHHAPEWRNDDDRDDHQQWPVCLELLDQTAHSRLSVEEAYENRTIRIGLTDLAIDQYPPAGSAIEKRLQRCAVVINTRSDRQHLVRRDGRVYLSPGVLQSIKADQTGACSATLLKWNAVGEIDFLSIETGQIRREKIELTLAEADRSAWKGALEQEFLEICQLCEQSPFQLLQLHWQLRCPAELIEHFDTQELQEYLDLEWYQTDRGKSVLHQLELIPLMAGRATDFEVFETGQFREEYLSEHFLQFLGEQIAGFTSSTTSNPLSIPVKPQATSLAWSDLQRKQSAHALGHRAAELGIRALNSTQRAS